MPQLLNLTARGITAGAKRLENKIPQTYQPMASAQSFINGAKAGKLMDETGKWTPKGKEQFAKTLEKLGLSKDARVKDLVRFVQNGLDDWGFTGFANVIKMMLAR